MEATSADFNYFLTPQAKADATLIARFRMESKINEVRSRDAGHPVTDDVLYVTIIQPGQKDPIWDNKASEDHIKRFSRQYKAFTDAQEVAQEGTPIEIWPVMTRQQVEVYKYLNIKTVEQVAELSEAVIGKVGIGARELQKKAKAWLAAAAGSADVQRHAVENDELKAELKELQKKVAELMAENKTLSKNLKRSE